MIDIIFGISWDNFCEPLERKILIKTFGPSNDSNYKEQIGRIQV